MFIDHFLGCRTITWTKKWTNNWWMFIRASLLDVQHVRRCGRQCFSPLIQTDDENKKTRNITPAREQARNPNGRRSPIRSGSSEEPMDLVGGLMILLICRGRVALTVTLGPWGGIAWRWSHHATTSAENNRWRQRRRRKKTCALIQTSPAHSHNYLLQIWPAIKHLDLTVALTTSAV